MLLLDWLQTSQKVLMADRLQDKKQRVCVTATWRAKMCDAKGLFFGSPSGCDTHTHSFVPVASDSI